MASASVVSLFVTVSKETMVGNERRFDKGLTIEAVKNKLELIVGTPPTHMKLQLYDQNDKLLGSLDDDTRMLGAYPVEDYMRIHVIDTNPARKAGEFSDVSAVPKFELGDEEYAQRQDSVRAYMQRNKLGRFAETAASEMTAAQAKEAQYDELAAKIVVGQRCEVRMSNTTARGTVRYVGQPSFAQGSWIGVHLDEPVGKNNGSVQDVAYFSCPNKHGVFVRPDAVQVGDYPEEDFEM